MPANGSANNRPGAWVIATLTCVVIVAASVWWLTSPGAPPTGSENASAFEQSGGGAHVETARQHVEVPQEQGVPDALAEIRAALAKRLELLPPISEEWPTSWIEHVQSNPEYRAAYAENMQMVAEQTTYEWMTCIAQFAPDNDEARNSLVSEIDGVRMSVNFVALAIEGETDGVVTNVDIFGPVADFPEVAECINESLRAREFVAPPNGVPMTLIAPMMTSYFESVRLKDGDPPPAGTVWEESDTRTDEQRSVSRDVIRRRVEELMRAPEFSQWASRFRP